MPALTKRQLDAAQELATAAIVALKSEAGIHPGSVVAATARMAGTYLFRSFKLSLPEIQPGQVVLSQSADAHGPILIETSARLLSRMGISLDPSKAGAQVDPEHQPAFTFLETQRLLEPAFSLIRMRAGFDDEQAAYATAAATSLLILHCRKLLDPHVGFNIAALGFIEGTKIAPDPVAQSASPPR